jgi:pimeloyl-ACP methyl ester carboxylesterase
MHMPAAAILLLAAAARAARAPLEIDLSTDDAPDASALAQLHGDLGGGLRLERLGGHVEEVQWDRVPGHDQLQKLYMEEVDESGRPKHLKEDGTPKGKFIRSRDGITHYVLHGQSSESSPTARIAVLAHGIGHRLDDFDAFVPALLSRGFRVLTYDYYGHGWSWFGPNVRLDLETMLRQLRELLDHVFETGLAIDLFVGHSAGGVLAVEAARNLPTASADGPGSPGRRIGKLALISPGFWKEGKWFVKFLDTCPALAQGLARVAPGQVAKAFLQAEDKAFARTQEGYTFHEAHEAAMRFWDRSFRLRLHPQALAGLVSMGTNMFSGEKQKRYREDFKELVLRLEGGDEANQGVQIYLLWGTKDEAVPFMHHKTVTEWRGGKGLRFQELQGMGHESPLENGKAVVDKIVSWYAGNEE